MQVSVEAGEGLERRMRVELTHARISEDVEKRLQRFGRTARLPGFRPGKVPMKLLRQRYGEQIQQEVFGDLVQSSFAEAVRQEGLHPAGLPSTIEPILDAESRLSGYTATFEVTPEIAPVPLDGRTVKRPVCAIADADIDAMIDQLRQQHRTWRPVERPCQTGDQVALSFNGTVDGEPFKGGSDEDIRIELGTGDSPPFPGFEDGLLGAAPGDRRTLEIDIPDSLTWTGVAGRRATFVVDLNAIEEPVLPEVDAAFVALFGIEDGDLARFRADVQANMERELERRLEALTKERVMDQLIDAHPVTLPEVMVRDEIHAMQEDMRSRLQAPARFRLPDSFFDDAARRRVRLRLILGALIRHWDLKPDPDAVRARVERIAASYENPQALIQHYYADPARLSGLESLVLEQQIVDRVLEQVTVEDEPIDFQSLAEQAPGG